MRLPSRMGRLRLLLCVILTGLTWIGVGSWLRDPEIDEAHDALIFHAWVVLALLFEVAVNLRLRDLDRTGWWSIPAWLLYPMSAYLGWVIQETAGQSAPWGLISELFFWVYAAGAVVVPVSLVYLLLAPSRSRGNPARPGDSGRTGPSTESRQGSLGQV